MLLNPELKARIINHMNDDHSDSNLIYAKVYAGLADAVSAQILDIEATHMRLAVELPSGSKTIDVAFTPALQEPGDAKARLIDMHNEGQEKLAATS